MVGHGVKIGEPGGTAGVLGESQCGAAGRTEPTAYDPTPWSGTLPADSAGALSGLMSPITETGEQVRILPPPERREDGLNQNAG